jgi:hypothetical protein
MNAIDKTLDFTSDLLGYAVIVRLTNQYISNSQGGYKKIEAAKISEKFDELKQNVGNSDVVSQSRDVGALLVANGLTALEAIGSVVGARAAQGLADVVAYFNFFME